jgi:hypothetical protein
MSKPWDPLGDMPDLHGKVAVVTGAKYVHGISSDGIQIETLIEDLNF